MINIFLPYTSFQIASFIRVLKNQKFHNEKWYLLTGFGTVKDENNCYLETLMHLLERSEGIKVINLKSPIGIILAVNLFFTDYRFISGNLRRLPSLFLGKYASEILALDDGVGTSIVKGYFDPVFKEKSIVKRILIKLGFVESYNIIHKKVSNHFTFFDSSVYSHSEKIKFYNLFEQLEMSEKIDNEIIIFISSSLSLLGADKYISKIKLFFPSQMWNSRVYFAAHPADKKNAVEKILYTFGMEMLDTKGLLLEDYILVLARSNVGVKLIGEENTSSAILRLVNSNNINFETRLFNEVD